jgi:immune inhibitor A
MKKSTALFALLALILCGAVLPASAMPLHPSLIQRIQAGEVPAPDDRQTVDEPGPARTIDMLRQRALDENMNIIAILVDFNDQPSNVEPVFFDSLLYGAAQGTVNNFYNEVSFGTVTLVTVNMPSALGWIRAPQTYAYYVDGQRGFGTYPHNAQRMMEDAVNAADSLVDFSQYDADNDGHVEGLFIIHSGPGYEITGSSDDIHSHAWSVPNPPYCDGVIVDRYSTEPEYWSNYGDMTCGVYAHEMGHSVFGLPDLYDTGYTSAGIGSWSLMAGGSWNGPLGSSPAHPDAWSLFRVGVVTPTVVTTNLSQAIIPAAELTPFSYRLWANGAYSSEFFLVENRQPIGYDAYLPGFGLLIYHVDQTVNSNTNPWYPGHTDNGHYRVAVEQADGFWNLEQDNNSGDANDPFPGGMDNHSFSSGSVPNSRRYSGSLTRVSVRNISASADTMTADIAVIPGAGNTILITMPDTNAVAGDLLCMPVRMDTIANATITSLHLRVQCDSTLLTVEEPYYDIIGGRLPSSWTVTQTHSAGILVLDASGSIPLTGIGQLLCLKFRVRSTALGGRISAINLSEFSFGDNAPVAEIVSGSVTVNAPEASFQPSAVSFGNVVLGQSRSLTFVLRSIGNVPLEVNTIFAPPPFTTNFTEPQTLQPDEWIPVRVTFSPELAQLYRDSLVIYCNAGQGEVRVPVSGTGVISGAVGDNPANLPTQFAVGSCYPNPFNPSTTISYDVPRTTPVTLSVYNVAGQLIEVPLHGVVEAGHHSLNWSCPDCGSGVYLFILAADGKTFLQKAMLLK